MTVSVLVPYRSGGDPHREAAWAYVRAWWADRYPTWQVTIGTPPDGPWCKAAAVAAALREAHWHTLVLADADVVCEGVAEAVQVVQGGAAGWAIPHGKVYRLSPDATRAAYARGPGQPITPTRTDTVEKVYQGIEGGGLVVLPRALYQAAGFDPRFTLWGGEDAAAGISWRTLAGAPWRAHPSVALVHLWHPPPERINRAIGSTANADLVSRYRAAARRGKTAMRALAREGAHHLTG